MKKKKIELMIKDFRNKIKSLENIIITLKNQKNNPYKFNKEIKKFLFLILTLHSKKKLILIVNISILLMKPN